MRRREKRSRREGREARKRGLKKRRGERWILTHGLCNLGNISRSGLSLVH